MAANGVSANSEIPRGQDIVIFIAYNNVPNFVLVSNNAQFVEIITRRTKTLCGVTSDNMSFQLIGIITLKHGKLGLRYTNVNVQKK